MKSIVQYFIKRHLFSNVLFFAIITLGIFMWFNIGKEEMPEFESNWIRVKTIYPGASAEDVELFVSKPSRGRIKRCRGNRGNLFNLKCQYKLFKDCD